MASITHVTCHHEGVLYQLESQGDEHLVMKITDVSSTVIKFNGQQLLELGFKQNSLESLKGTIVKFAVTNHLLDSHQFAESTSSHSTSNWQESELRPLQENPLHQPGSGFMCAVDRSSSYFINHPAWCEAVESRSYDLSNDQQRLLKLADCQRRLSLGESEIFTGTIEKEFLDSIQQHVEKIVDALESQKPDFRLVNSCMRAICEASFQLLMKPISNAFAFSNDTMKICILNQSVFRRKLAEVPTSANPVHATIRSAIHGSMSMSRIESTVNTLVNDYPEEKEYILRLATKARELIEDEREKIKQDVNSYLKDGIRECLLTICTICPDKEEHLELMLRGRFRSVAEVPRDVFSGEISRAWYLPVILQLVDSFKLYRETTFDARNQSLLKCQTFLQALTVPNHFNQTIKPLVLLWSKVKAVLAWPAVYQLSEWEKDFLHINLSFLMAISNKNLTPIPYVNYQYLRVSKEALSEAQKTRKNNKSSLEQKREACRMILHSRIPWRSLSTTAQLCHRSGGVSDERASKNRKLLWSYFPLLFREFPLIAQSIEDLIEFELTGDLAILERVTAAPNYPTLSLLGSFMIARRDMESLVEILNYWNNLRLSADELNHPTVKQACLRTLQILGELSKNLSEVGLLGDDPFWGWLTELRDLLSHPEMISTNQRVKELINGDDLNTRRNFSELRRDFLTLLDLFTERKRALHTIDSEESLRSTQLRQQGRRYQFLELKGIEELYLALTIKISAEVHAQLRATCTSSAAQAVCQKVIRAKARLKARCYESYVEDVDMLPVAKVVRGDLKKAIKIQISPNAAENDCRDAKAGLLKAVFNELDSVNKTKIANEKAEERKNWGTDASSAEILKHPVFLSQCKVAEKALEELKANWPDGKDPSVLKNITMSLGYAKETVQEYTDRKAQDTQENLEDVITYPTQHEASEAGELLIRNLQLQPPSEKTLFIQLSQLGVEERHFQLWKITLRSCLQTTVQEPQADDRAKAEDVFALAVKKGERFNHLIRLRLTNLKEIFIKDKNKFMINPLLRLGIEYVVSDFRAFAGNLVACLQLIGQEYPYDRQFFLELERSLLGAVNIGDALLHVRDRVEPGTLTPFGQQFIHLSHLYALVFNQSRGQDHDFVEESLDTRLQRLDQVLKNYKWGSAAFNKDLK